MCADYLARTVSDSFARKDDNMTEENIQDDMLITLTADIVAAHVSNNMIAVNDVPQLIENVHTSLAKLYGAAIEEEKPEPAVSIRASIKPDYIVCLEDGKKLKMLKLKK